MRIGMIITKDLNIKVNSTSLKHYLSKGYNDVKINDVININPDDLPESSTYKLQVKCDICGNEKILSYGKYLKNFLKHKIYCCSNKCAHIKNKKTNLEKYGNENYFNFEKYKKTCLEKYGVDNIFKLDSTKNKIKNSNKNKYGVESHNSSDIIKQKKREVNLKKFGVDNYFKLDVHKKRMKEDKDSINIKRINTYRNTCKSLYDVDHTSKIDYIRENIKNTNQKTSLLKLKKLYNEKNIIIKDIDFNNKKYIIECDKCNLDFIIEYTLLKNRLKSKTEICTFCNPISKHISGLEIQLNDFIKNNINNSLQNNKSIISPNELDIYIPNLKIAFEFNGLFWHNELNKENNYHLNKTEECEKQGIQLIHIYEDDWLYKQDIIKSMILNKLDKTPNKIYARQTEIKEVSDNKLVKNFLENNHIQGFIGSKIKLGLFYNNELISLMTFGNRRVAMGKKSTNEGEYELLRFCNKLNTNVIGGASKLFKYFVDNYQLKEITTYADRSYSQGKLYQTLGFKFIGKTQPNYYYIINGIRKHRFNFRKDVLVKQGFDPNKTEHEIMLEKNIYRIYDSGNLIFKYVSRK